MIKITLNSGSKTITVLNTDTNYSRTILGKDCIVDIEDKKVNIYDVAKIRTIYIKSKYNGYVLGGDLTSLTLDSGSTGYSSDMDTYYAYLIASILYI
jgi:hypothetical protein